MLFNMIFNNEYIYAGTVYLMIFEVSFCLFQSLRKVFLKVLPMLCGMYVCMFAGIFGINHSVQARAFQFEPDPPENCHLTVKKLPKA